MVTARRLSLLLMLALLAPCTQAAPVLSLCYNKEGSYPWIDRTRPGLGLRMATMIATRAGMQVELTGTTWQRCLQEVKAQHFDGALGASYREERREFGRYPELEKGVLNPAKRIFIEQHVLVRPKGSQIHWDGKSVQPASARVAAPAQVSVVAALRAQGMTVDDGTKSTEATLRKVALARADVAIVLADGARHEMARFPELAEKLEIVTQPIEERVYFIMLGHGLDDATARRIWDACEHVRESPEFAAVQKAFLSGQ
jgi:polar amino acid transport system substrate-binding protein